MMKGSPGIWESPLDGDDQLDNPLGSNEHLHDEMEATMRKLMAKGSPGNWESLLDGDDQLKKPLGLLCI